MFPPSEETKVLDVGCGTGIQPARYQQAGCWVTGIDASPAMLEVARRRLGTRASLTVGDAARNSNTTQTVTVAPKGRPIQARTAGTDGRPHQAGSRHMLTVLTPRSATVRAVGWCWSSTSSISAAYRCRQRRGWQPTRSLDSRAPARAIIVATAGAIPPSRALNSTGGAAHNRMVRAKPKAERHDKPAAQNRC